MTRAKKSVNKFIKLRRHKDKTKSKSTDQGSYYIVQGVRRRKKKYKFLRPSQVLLEHQDAKVEEIIHMTQITAERVRKSKNNNFGIPKGVDWNQMFSNKKSTNIKPTKLTRNKSKQNKSKLTTSS